jgi:ribosomal protein L11 methyltransferase
MSAKASWFEIKFTIVEVLREPVINRLFELGAEGVAETDAYPYPMITAYFEDKGRDKIVLEMTLYLDSLADMHSELPPVKWEVRDLELENWAERYKQFYQAQKLNELFFLVPAWDTTTKIPDQMIPIHMEPGQAFGTGLHASTRLAIELVQRAVDLHALPDPLKLMDVGTGSGILAIAAEKLGVGEVWAIDNDPLALTVAEENIKRNNCTKVKILTELLPEMKENCDIIVSNILLETHRELAPHYARLIKPGGQLVLSGLLASQRRDVDAIFLSLGFVQETAENFQEWGAVCYSLNSEALKIAPKATKKK